MSTDGPLSGNAVAALYRDAAAAVRRGTTPTVVEHRWLPAWWEGERALLRRDGVRPRALARLGYHTAQLARRRVGAAWTRRRRAAR